MAIQIFFWFVAALAILGGVGVITFRQPIKNVLSLVGTMLSLALMFLLLSAQFVFVVQIIVYTGAVMVLFLFVVALLGPAREDRAGHLRFHWWLAPLAGLVFLAFVWSMLSGLTYHAAAPVNLNVFGTVASIAVGLFGQYLFPFELTSILLLVAAVGAIYLSRGGYQQGSPDDDKQAELDSPTTHSALPAEDREAEVSTPAAAAGANRTDEKEEPGA
ncbi:MAG TPA: NADH-quinone oxidoreductase subunit J [Candidatus Dormibacteraeota bacterium]|nr:NADH-quinone oxidoreductase subunit J [Candidatus Dormibacteraeota bacterium]